MMEVWLEISQAPRYLVSSHGRFFDRLRQCYLSVNSDRNGYCRVKMWIDGERRTISAHRIVAGTFYEDDIAGWEINHEDGIKANNFVGNLSYTDRPGNMRHAYETGLVALPRETQVRCVETDDVFRTMREAARAIGASDHKSIARVIDNPNRTCKGYHFETVERSVLGGRNT